MSTKYKITIPEPCSEDWNLMTPQEKGRHCVVCDKVVVDFSKATKQEIINHITKEGKICGRIPRAFLDTNLVDESERQTFGTKGLVATVINLLALTTTMYAQVKEESKQELSSVLEKKSSTMNEQQSVIHDEDKQYGNIINGTVFSASDSLPLPGASVFLVKTGYGVLTNMNGEFSLNIPTNTTSDELTIIFELIGFESKKIPINLTNKNKIKVYLEDSVEEELQPLFLGYITIKKKKRFWLF